MIAIGRFDVGVDPSDAEARFRSTSIEPDGSAGEKMNPVEFWRITVFGRILGLILVVPHWSSV